MPDVRAPGVFVEEIPSGPPPIAGVGIATTCFLGQINGVFPDTPPLVTSLHEALRIFEQLEAAAPFAASIKAFFDNGGRRLYIARIAGETVTAEDLRATADLPDINIIAAPGLTDAATHDALISYCEGRKDRFAVLDLSPVPRPASEMAQIASAGGLRPRNADRGVAAVYAPWVDVATAGTSVRIAPSGPICGVYARVDESHGVHKAPTNVPLRGVLGLARDFTDTDQDILTPAHINLIRSFPRRGIVSWGARTLANGGGDYTYIPVRRLATYVERSISGGLTWAVFEPNGERLWDTAKQLSERFLHVLWRQGALAGTKSSEAFFVRCDRTTMTQTDITNGRLIVEIGIAPLKPAEFVLFRIGQKTAEAQS